MELSFSKKSHSRPTRPFQKTLLLVTWNHSSRRSIIVTPKILFIEISSQTTSWSQNKALFVSSISVSPKHPEQIKIWRPLLALHTTWLPKFSMARTVKKLISGPSVFCFTRWFADICLSKVTVLPRYSVRSKRLTITSTTKSLQRFLMSARIWFASS